MFGLFSSLPSPSRAQLPTCRPLPALSLPFFPRDLEREQTCSSLDPMAQAYPTDDELADMPLRIRKAIARFAGGGSPHKYIAQPDNASDSDPDADEEYSSSFDKPVFKFVIRPLTAQEDQIPEGTDQPSRARTRILLLLFAVHLEELLPRTLSICLDTAVVFVTPANVAVCPEDRAVYLGRSLFLP
ncbi:hypothetical protein BDY24DRAFT_443921 [Mrakia frigida]|uniref:uncharacterized protein n=1 Tax=Mrakia frigida TaxID=29902 RepID=UPI003FCC0C96